MSLAFAVPPLTPDAPDAATWLRDELAKPEYTAAKPTPFDRAVSEFLAWLGRLFSGDTSTPADWVPVAIILLVLAAVAAAIIIWGRPRLNRSRRAASHTLFGENDTRSAAAIRAASQRAAAAGDYTTAVLEAFRALSRDLDERTIIILDPGSTAHQAARAAAMAFPKTRELLAQSADYFDGVRYLSEPGTSDHWEYITAVDAELRAQSPQLAEIPEGATR